MRFPRLASALCCFLLFSTVRARTSEPTIESLEHVRPEDAVLQSALVHGRRDSATFHDLVDRLDTSTVIVYIVRRHSAGYCDGRTQFVTSAGGYRYLRIVVDAGVRNDRLVALLAHELRHAEEVVDAPWVIDADSFRILYQGIGEASRRCAPGRECYDTRAAIDAGYSVLREIRGGTQ